MKPVHARLLIYWMNGGGTYIFLIYCLMGKIFLNYFCWETDIQIYNLGYLDIGELYATFKAKKKI